MNLRERLMPIRDELEQEIHKMQSDLDRLELLMGDEEQGFVDMTKPNALNGPDSISAVVSIIRKEGKPLTLREIWDTFTAIGYTIDGKDPLMALGARINRSPELTVWSQKPKRYAPSDELYFEDPPPDMEEPASEAAEAGS